MAAVGTGEKKQKKKEELQKEDKKRTEERQDEHDEENLIEPLFETPPQKVFSELDGISHTVDDGGKSMPITEDAVVDTINRFRKGIDDEVKEDNKVTDKKLQKGNVSTAEEVVNIINKQRNGKKKEEKIPYQRFELSPLFSEENEAGSKLSSKEHKFLKLVIPSVPKGSGQTRVI
ncbi:hypothetical protein RhiirA4_511354 [Rhizophagus irregularis]|uniref:Uncharacterized protein n=1 Tax=Rhizophagus irregularis TaxID=588596 RepID=A0A2I1GB05_9GLOM|nr:hypothetical protein RhiirA4_511354 [Rhizophagus irregularis]